MQKIALYIILGIVVLALLSMMFSSLAVSTVEDDNRPTFVVIYDNILKSVERIGNIFSRIGNFIIDLFEVVVEYTSIVIDWIENLFADVDLEEAFQSHFKYCDCNNNDFADANGDCVCDDCSNPFDPHKVPYGILSQCELCGKDYVDHKHSFIVGQLTLDPENMCHICEKSPDDLIHHHGNCCENNK